MCDFVGRADQTLELGDPFYFVDAKIEKKEREDNYRAADGTNYQTFKMVARITKFINTTGVPLEGHMLNIFMEGAVHDAAKLHYVVDSAENFISRVKVPSYTVTGSSHVVKLRTYRTNYGDPWMQAGKGASFSHYVFELTLKRFGMGIYFKFSSVCSRGYC